MSEGYKKEGKKEKEKMEIEFCNYKKDDSFSSKLFSFSLVNLFDKNNEIITTKVAMIN